MDYLVKAQGGVFKLLIHFAIARSTEKQQINTTESQKLGNVSHFTV